jgi:hypothetical protein
MATKKKSNKAMKSKRTSSKKVTGTRRASKKDPPKRATAKKKAGASSIKAIRTAGPARRKTTRGSSRPQGAAFELETGRSRSGGQSGDLQGLRDFESADSESVDELLEEGNAFEADVVAGVEHAEDDEEREVHTHEVPEDDVPEEYLDKD